MTPSASGRPKNTFSGGVGGRGVVSVSGCRVGVGVLFRGRGVVSGSGCQGQGVRGRGVLPLELALDFPEEERMMQQSSVSISLNF